MNPSYYSFKNVLLLMAFLLFANKFAFGQAELMHSYTFEEGTYDASTVYDVVGSVDGTISGSGTISDGIFTTGSDSDLITFDGAALALSTYSSITLEVYVTGGDASNPGNTIMAYFGAGSGSYAYWIALARKEDRAATCYNKTYAKTQENGELEDGELHHVVAILTNSNISLYIDGSLVSQVDQSTLISDLSPTYAQLLRPAGWGDVAWKGSIHEFNIYEGELDPVTILQHAVDFRDIDPLNAKLSSITTNTGILSPTFDPENFEYDIEIDYGIPSLTLEAVPEVEGANVAIEDGLGNVVVDGFVNNIPYDGIDVTITVTALNGIKQQDYQVSIDVKPGAESPNLTSIDVSKGIIISEFHPDTLVYTAILPYGTTSVDVTANKAWSGATVSGDGTIDLPSGTDTITISVTSEDGYATKDYSLILYVSEVSSGQSYYFVHETSGYVFAEGDNTFLQLQYPMKDSTKQLFQLEESGVSGQYFIKNGDNRYIRLSDDKAWDLYLTDALTTDQDSCRFILHEFEPGRFLIESVIKSGEERKNMGTSNNEVYGGVYSDKRTADLDPYIFWNIELPENVMPYNLYLSDLSIDVGSLHPEFDMFVDEYYVVLPIGTTALNVAATTHDATSSVASGTGAIDVSAGSGTIIVTVAGADPLYTKDYSIHYLVNTPLTLKHSYTFEDGTAQDQEGEAHGNVAGDHIKNGMFASVADGDYISLPGDMLQIGSYPSLTLEAYIATNGSNIGKYTMISYFGGDMGSNAVWMQPTRNDGTGQSATGAHFKKAYGFECDDIGGNYHMVSVLTYDTLYFYINGAFQSKIAAYDVLRNISTKNALIAETAYNDPSWVGSMYEFNIYSGVMDAQTVATRYANFPIEDSTSDATLSDLMLDGATIEGFAPHALNYVVEYPAGTTTVPTVTATARYAANGATLVVEDASTLPDTATVVVTAIDGSTEVTYNVIFKFEASDNDSLSEITINGTVLEGFNPEVLKYTVRVPEGDPVPTVTATPQNAFATVEIVPATGVPGSTLIKVTAEDGETTATYTINFIIDVPDDATLSNLTVDGTAIDGFDPATVSYLFRVSKGTTVVPTVAVVTNDPNASAAITAATAIPGTTSIIVTAGDGTTTNTYQVNFDFMDPVEEHGESTVSVYPTVFKEVFNVESSELINTVKVTDVNGKVLHKYIVNAFDYTVKIDNAGMHIVEVISAGNVYTYRVFKAN